MKNENRPRIKPRRILPVIITLVLGIILSVALYLMVHRWETRRIKSEFEAESNNFVVVLNNSIMRTQGVLRSLAAFNLARRDVSERGFDVFASEFKAFSTCSLSCHTETQLLGWVPHVRKDEREFYESMARESGYEDFQFTEMLPNGEFTQAKERDEYYVIYNVEPYEESKYLLGYDLTSDPTFIDAMIRARDSGVTAATGWINYKKAFGGKFGYMLFLPIYLEKTHHDSVANRRENFEGFAIGFFTIEELINIAFDNYDIKGVDIHLYDKESYEKDDWLIYRTRLGSLIAHADDEKLSDYMWEVTKTIKVGGREWVLTFHPNEKYIKSHDSWVPKGFLAMGLVLTSIMVTYLIFSAGETTYIEQLVSKRTRELKTTNTRLESEVNKHKVTGDALKESEENYRNMYNNAQIGMFRVEISNGGVINANATFAHMFGYDSKEEVIAEFIMTDRFENSDDYVKMLTELQEKGEIVNFEVSLLKKDGSVTWARIWAHIYLEKAYIEGVITDISEERKVEEDNQRLQSQLLQAQKMESIGRLAGGVAHDFNNMLTGIMGYTELALGDISSEHPAHKKLKVIEDSSMKAAALTRQLLAFSRRQILDMKVIDLNIIIKNASKLHERLIGDDIMLELNMAKKVKNVFADPAQIEQILMNLVVNARDAMSEGGILTIETNDIVIDKKDIADYKGIQPDPYVMFSVADTGCGISEEEQEKIFEPFYTTKQVGKGTGLGLSTVFGIIKQHKGYIFVDSEVGSGTKFEVFLRVHKGRKTKIKVEEPTEMAHGSETILVVDDEQFVCDLMKDTLSPLGYSVFTASNSDEAFKLCYLRNGEIDLLLSDIVMPGIDGRELGKMVKSKWPDVKVMYMTGYSDDVILQYGIESSGLKIIMKPLVPTKIAKKIRDFLDSKAV